MTVRRTTWTSCLCSYERGSRQRDASNLAGPRYALSSEIISSFPLSPMISTARYGIRVNTIAPSAFRSAMTDRMPEKTRASLVRELNFPKRFGSGHEFAQTVKFVIECGYMNGETIRLSGGARLPGRL